MATQRQIDANKQNASKSTGPKTIAGKTVASKNAIRHGLTAQQILVPGESADEFDKLVHRLIKECEPVGELELKLVERITVCLWRQSRVYRIEFSRRVH
jgi:hypothetical protein